MGYMFSVIKAYQNKPQIICNTNIYKIRISCILKWKLGTMIRSWSSGYLRVRGKRVILVQVLEASLGNIARPCLATA